MGLINESEEKNTLFQIWCLEQEEQAWVTESGDNRNNSLLENKAVFQVVLAVMSFF